MPSPRNNNDPMPVLAPLPDEQYEENLPDVVTDPGLQSPMDFETGYDRINDLDASRDVPQKVVEDSYNMPEAEVRRATPALRNEGSFFDLSYINDFRAAYQQALQQTGDPAKAVEMVRPIAQSWTPAQRHVYERTEGYAEVDPKYAAGLVQDWYAQQDREAAAQNRMTDPAKAREQSQQAARVQSVLGIMDKYTADDSGLDDLVGPAAGSFVANEWDKWNNPDRYAKRFELSFTTKTEVLEAAKYVKPLSNDERKFLEEMFPRRDDPPQVWREYFKRTREILSQGLPQQPQAQGAAPAAAAPQSSQPPPNLKPTRIDPVTGQTMTLTQNQQGKWVYRLAPQQQSSNATGR